MTSSHTLPLWRLFGNEFQQLIIPTSGGFRLVPGGTGPPNLAQAPQILIGSRGVLGVYRRTRVYAVYQPLVFFDSV